MIKITDVSDFDVNICDNDTPVFIEVGFRPEETFFDEIFTDLVHYIQEYDITPQSSQMMIVIYAKNASS